MYIDYHLVIVQKGVARGSRKKKKLARGSKDKCKVVTKHVFCLRVFLVAH